MDWSLNWLSLWKKSLYGKLLLLSSSHSWAVKKPAFFWATLYFRARDIWGQFYLFLVSTHRLDSLLQKPEYSHTLPCLELCCCYSYTERIVSYEASSSSSIDDSGDLQYSDPQCTPDVLLHCFYSFMWFQSDNLGTVWHGEGYTSLHPQLPSGRQDFISSCSSGKVCIQTSSKGLRWTVNTFHIVFISSNLHLDSIDLVHAKPVEMPAGQHQAHKQPISSLIKTVSHHIW